MKQGWEEKRLKDIGVTQTGTTPKTSDKDNYGEFIPFIKPADIDIYNDGKVRYDNDGLSEKGLRAGRKMTNGSILMVCIGATIGKVGYVDRDVSCNQQVNSLSVSKEFSPKFFYYALSTPSFYQQIMRSAAQATLPIINKGKWECLTVKYPKSFAEQQRIVAILDEAFSAIAKAKANAEKNLKNAKELFESYLQGILGNKDETWEETVLKDEICLLVGYAFKSKDYTKEEDDIFLLRGDNIMQGSLRLENVKRLRKEEYEVFKKYQLQENDIVLAMDRPWVKAGLKIARLSKNELPALLVQRTACLRAKSKLINTFLFYLLKSNCFMNYLIDVQTGIGVPHISGQQILDFTFNRPSIRVQQKIVQKIDAISTQAKQLESIYQKKINDLEELKKSILQKAFSGELTSAKVALA